MIMGMSAKMGQETGSSEEEVRAGMVRDHVCGYSREQ